MRMAIRTLLFILTLWAFAHTPSALAARPADRPDTTAFKIEVGHMSPTAYRSRTLDAGYTLEVRNDSVFCHLPYIGQAYGAQPAGWDGLEFDTTVRDWEAREGKKGSRIIRFRCSHDATAYVFDITLHPDGRADIEITPSTAQRISYGGRLIPE